MLSSLIDAAMDITAGGDHCVNMEGLKTMYHLLWDNPNASRRKQFRAKMKELEGEDGWGAQRALKHLDEMANLIGVEIIVMPHGPRGGKQTESGWQQPETKKKNKETHEKEREKEKEKEKTKKEAKKPGGGEKGEGKAQGKNGKGKGGEAKAAASAEPQWEEGALEQGEWDTPLLRQEGVVPDGKGVALCSRKVFLEKVDFWVSNRKLVVVLPGGKEWFQTKDFTQAAADG